MRKLNVMGLVALAGLMLAARTVPAAAAASATASVSMDLVTSGAAQKMGLMRPTELPLADKKPAALKKAPKLASPLYGTFKFSGVSHLVALDAPQGKPQRLYVDANANGDLTDDPAVAWAKPAAGANSRILAEGCFVLPLRDGAKSTPVTIDAVSLAMPAEADDAAPASAKGSVRLLYYPGYCYSGEVKLAGKTFKAFLYDSLATGDFTYKAQPPASGMGDVVLFLDLNGNGQFREPNEIFDVLKPFKIEGQTWEIAGLTPGGSFQIAKSDKKLPDPTPTPQAPPSAGAKAIPFKATRMDGKAVDFPADYKGKLVILDFWATWCGPCMHEVPNVVKAYNQYHAKGVEILGISLDRADSADKIKRVTEKNGMTWPQVYDGRYWQAAVAQLYSIQSIPNAFLIDGDSGAILAAGDDLRDEGLAKALEAALAKKGPAGK